MNIVFACPAEFVLLIAYAYIVKQFNHMAIIQTMYD